MENELLNKQLMSLKDAFYQLGTQLADAGECLQTLGMLPSVAITESLTAARMEVDLLREELVAEARSLELYPIPQYDDLNSLGELESLLHTITQAWEARKEVERFRQRAVRILAQVERVTHSEFDQFAPLFDMQKKASDLREAVCESGWMNLHPEAQALSDGHHPFSKLMTLVEQQEQLEDEEWIELQEIVAASFGQALSVAAARGKLFVAEPTADEEGLSGVHRLRGEASPAQEVVLCEATAIGDELEQATLRDDGEASAFEIAPTSRVTEATLQNPESTDAKDPEFTETHEEASSVPSFPTFEQMEDDSSQQNAHPNQDATPFITAPEPAQDDRVNPPAMKQADVDRFLKEQLDSVRKQAVMRQKKRFMKSIGRKFI